MREALEWAADGGTPYHPRARIKGVGVDCGLFLAEVFERAGRVPHIVVPNYVGDEHVHNPEETYLQLVLGFAHEIKFGEQQPGDVLLWKFAKRLSHSAIIVDWPRVVHATRTERRVWVCDLSQDDRYPPEKARYFSVF